MKLLRSYWNELGTVSMTTHRTNQTWNWSSWSSKSSKLVLRSSLILHCDRKDLKRESSRTITGQVAVCAIKKYRDPCIEALLLRLGQNSQLSGYRSKQTPIHQRIACTWTMIQVTKSCQQPKEVPLNWNDWVFQMTPGQKRIHPVVLQDCWQDGPVSI